MDRGAIGDEVNMIPYYASCLPLPCDPKQGKKKPEWLIRRKIVASVSSEPNEGWVRSSGGLFGTIDRPAISFRVVRPLSLGILGRSKQ